MPILLKIMHKDRDGNRLIGDGAYGFITVDRICDGKGGKYEMEHLSESIVHVYNQHNKLVETLKETVRVIEYLSGTSKHSVIYNKAKQVIAETEKFNV